MVSNSLLAYASVNHLHYHFLYLDHPVLASRVVSCPHSILSLGMRLGGKSASFHSESGNEARW